MVQTYYSFMFLFVGLYCNICRSFEFIANGFFRAGDEIMLKAKISIILENEFRVSNPETVTIAVLRVDAFPLAREPFMRQLCQIPQNAQDSFAFFTSDSGESTRLSVKSRNTRLTASYSPGDACAGNHNPGGNKHRNKIPFSIMCIIWEAIT